MVEVGQKDRLRVGGLDVLSRTAVAVAAGADLVVERAVYFISFCTEDRGEVVRHFEGGFEVLRRVRREMEVLTLDVEDRAMCACSRCRVAGIFTVRR